MNTITSKELRKKFKKEWSDLTQIWLRNKMYVIPTLQELKDVVKLYPVNLPVINGFNECENFALYLHANVKEYRVSDYGDKPYNWTFGDFICKKETMFFGTVTHTACICLCTEGFYFIEPLENNLVIKANDDYKPFFINLM